MPINATIQQSSLSPPPPPPPPPPPAALPAPTNLTATPVSATRINLAWAETATNETGFQVDRCSGAACTNFALIGTGAANAVTFADSVGLVASTQYSYRVRAFNATDTSAYTATASATTLAGTAGTSFTMVGAGEITSCRAGGSVQTAALIDKVIESDPNTIVFSTGSSVSDTTTGCSYPAAFNASGWAKFLPRMRAALTQRDYTVGAGLNESNNTPGPGWIYETLGSAVGPRGKGWFSFDVGTSWHVVVLNTATWEFPNGADMLTNPSSEQNMWLQADLAANTKPCVMAILGHRRIYSGGTSHKNFNALQIWTILYNAKADVVISGWDKIYERYAQINRDGVADPNGIRQFIVGTGGRSLDALVPAAEVLPSVEKRDASTWGVLKLKLNDNSYEWEFMPTIPGGFTDKSTEPVACHS